MDRCNNCGAELKKHDDVCPVCKEPVSVVKNIPAVAGFSISLLGLIGTLYLFYTSAILFYMYAIYVGLIGIVGFIISLIGLRKAKNTQDNGKRFALWGIVISVLNLVGHILLIFFWTHVFWLIG